jgi:hypothetical protein
VAGAGVLLAVAAAGWVAHRTRPAVNGEWQGELHYAWADAPRVEHFVFDGQGQVLIGSASFLGVPRGVLAGQVDGDGLRFDTRTNEMGGPDLLHHYRGQLVGDEIRFVMQTEGGSAAHEPVVFVARRIDAKSGR